MHSFVIKSVAGLIAAILALMLIALLLPFLACLTEASADWLFAARLRYREWKHLRWLRAMDREDERRRELGRKWTQGK